MTTRKNEIANQFAEVRQQINSAAMSAGRKPEDLHLIVVTKTWPASDVRILAELGATDVGENKAQEATAKFDECRDLGLKWHFIGQLQTNKVSMIAPYIDVVHSIDRSKLVKALGAAAVSAGRTITGLVQVSLDPPEVEGRAGIDPADALELATEIDSTPGLILGGVMAVAPLGEDPAVAFSRLVPVVDQIQAKFPAASMVSAGMSNDLAEAIAAGATHLRIGSAILGSR